MQTSKDPNAAAAKVAQSLTDNPKLIADALKFAKARLSRQPSSTIRHLSADDLVNDAFGAILAGERACRGTVALPVLRSIMNSRLFAERLRRSNSVTVLADDLHACAVDAAVDTDTADKAIQHDEEEQCRARLIRLFRSEIGDDEELQRFADAILAGAKKPKDIASYLKATPGRIKTVRKRFARHAKRFRAKHHSLTASLERDTPRL